MSALVLHPLTERQIEQFQARPAHAVILTGATGCGKRSLAVWLAEVLAELTAGSFASYGYGKIIAAPDNKAIGIEAVRELEHFMSLKVPTAKAINRVVIIENSHALTPEAQNALLKTLEEPPAGTVLILTASSEKALLPTIRSRAQLIAIHPPEKTPLYEHFSTQGHAQSDIARAYSVSGGLPGLMQALLTAEDHPLKAATEKARQLLACGTFARLALVDELAKQKQLTIDVLFILQQMARLALHTATGAASQRWQRVLRASYEASEALAVSGQPKLVLTNLMLNL